MINRYRLNSILFLLLVFLAKGPELNAQQRKQLEDQKARTQEQIEETNQLLLETQQSRRSTTQRVRILNKRIQLRNEIISNISREVDLIDQEIEEKNLHLKEMESDLEEVREQYARLVIHSYWNKSRRDWMLFIMSAENFNQAYRRMRYLQKFTEYRKQQAKMIASLKRSIVQEIEDLEEVKLEKEALALEKRNENSRLLRERRGKDRVVADLSRKEKELRKEISDKQRVAEKLEKEIAALIAAEARKARSGNMYDQLTPEEKLISDNFLGNKGKLPWPVTRGVITGKYGVHPHPVLKQVTVDSDGIDISTVKGAEARAMFDGVVTKIISILGRNYAVIIRHGNFLTVYQNLVDLRVKQGDKVNVKDVLGTVNTDSQTNSTVLHVQVWQDRSSQNPEDWLSRK
jgi:septal ring factor EnvC (AmiA/AmiB activator)